MGYIGVLHRSSHNAAATTAQLLLAIILLMRELQARSKDTACILHHLSTTEAINNNGYETFQDSNC
jgi:hypothetical protein